MLNDHFLEGIKHVRPSENPNAHAKISCEFVNLCNELYENYGKRMNNTASRWAKRLVYSDYTIHEVRSAVDKTVETCERIPSYSEFKTILSQFSRKNDSEAEEQKRIDEKCEILRKNTEHMHKMFLSKYSEEQLNKLLNKWFDAVYSDTNPEMFGLSKRVFLPIFFQDLAKAKGDIALAITYGLESK